MHGATRRLLEHLSNLSLSYALNVAYLSTESKAVSRVAVVAAGLVENDEFVRISGFLALSRGETTSLYVGEGMDVSVRRHNSMYRVPYTNLRTAQSVRGVVCGVHTKYLGTGTHAESYVGRIQPVPE